jgi:hypothetical protein
MSRLAVPQVGSSRPRDSLAAPSSRLPKRGEQAAGLPTGTSASDPKQTFASALMWMSMGDVLLIGENVRFRPVSTPDSGDAS